MTTLDKILGGMFFLIAVFLIVASRKDVNTIIGTIGQAVTNTTKTLQGRSA